MTEIENIVAKTNHAIEYIVSHPEEGDVKTAIDKILTENFTAYAQQEVERIAGLVVPRAQKFINKAIKGQSRSAEANSETYEDMKYLVELFEELTLPPNK